MLSVILNLRLEYLLKKLIDFVFIGSEDTNENTVKLFYSTYCNL